MADHPTRAPDFGYRNRPHRPSEPKAPHDRHPHRHHRRPHPHGHDGPLRVRRGPGDRRRLHRRTGPGGFLAVCDGVPAHMDAELGERATQGMRPWQEKLAQPHHMRTVEEFARFFDGLEPVEPGVVSVLRRRPEPTEVGTVHDLPRYAGPAKKA
ncbi:MAG TPA: SAM-dependent methyltransferase [Nocardiopsis listeri]|nr:SAM-dependent methyltransferase [Nocardiopsis listeri]